MTKAISLIIGRKGSSLKDKNLRVISGLPSVEWVARAGSSSQKISRLFASSDSSELLAITSRFGYEPISRPRNLTTSEALGCDVLKHALEEIRARGCIADVVVLHHANAPAVSAELIDACLERLDQDQNASAVVPVRLEVGSHPYRQKALDKSGYLVSHFPSIPDFVTSNRQSLPSSFSLLHNLWVVRLVNGQLPSIGEPPWHCLGDAVLPFVLEQYPGDIDSEDDVTEVEAWLTSQF